MKWNLRNRILVPTLALVLTLIVALSTVSYRMSSSALTETMEAELDTICTSGLREVEHWIESQRANLRHWAQQPHTATAFDAARAAQARATLNQEFADAKTLFGYYEEIVLADLQGATIACSNPEMIGRLDVSDRTYFRDAARGSTVLSPVLKSRVSGRPIVVIATPVQTDGTVRGVLYGILDLDWFNREFVANIKVLDTGYVFMFDEQGVFIAHPDAQRILTTKLGDFDWSRPILDSNSGMIEYVFADDRKIASYRKSETLRWGLVATVSHREVNAGVNRMARVNLGLGIGALVSGVLLIIVTVRSITRPLQQATATLTNGASQTSAAAAQVSAASQSLAEGASEQAASLEETSASVEEINSMTRRNAEHAQNAKSLSQETRHAADQGSAQMEEMVRAMNDIKASADNIAKIVKSIDEIAFQTNILALNAAVEAARAGEAGAGFAVVAEEVRNLAQRAAHAAKETADRIEDSIRKSATGVDVSAKAAESLQLIASRARRVDELVAEIATASQEQTRGLAQISTAMTQMDKVTQANAGNAEETAAAAEELNAQALAAAEVVAELTRLVEGGAAEHRDTVSAPTSAKATQHRAAPPVAPPPGTATRPLRRPALPAVSHAAAAADFRAL